MTIDDGFSDAMLNFVTLGCWLKATFAKLGLCIDALRMRERHH